MPLPLDGVHHLRLPVSDVAASVRWYEDTLGLRVLLLEEEADAVVGALLDHDAGLLVSLRLAPERAQALRGFAVLAVAVSDLAELQRWEKRLTALGVPHGPVRTAHLGYSLDVPDPDGVIVQLHTREQVSVEAT